MNPTDNIEKFIKKASLNTNPERDETVLNEVLGAQEKSKITNPAASQPNIRRIIMNNRIAKFSITVAAAVIIVAIIGLWPKAGDTGKVYGMSDVPEIIQKAHTIHIKRYHRLYGQTRIYVEEKNGKIITEDHGEITSDEWIDIENGRFRTTGLGGASYKGEEFGIKLEFIFDGENEIQINHSFKHGQLYSLDESQKISRIREQVDKFLKNVLFSDDDIAEGYVKTGREEIDGVNFEIWEYFGTIVENEWEVKGKYWLSPHNGELKKVQCWEKSKKTDGEWLLFWEDNIEFNVAPPDGIFEPVAPDGYRVNTIK